MQPTETAASLQDFADRLATIRGRIRAAAERAGRDPREVQLVGASKLMPPERIELAVRAGLEHLGENRVQEARKKREALRRFEPQPTWHLIGHLQTNKAKYAATLFDWIHSVDSMRLAEEIDRRCRERDAPMQVLVEVNTSGESSKEGVAPGDAVALLESVGSLPNLRARGFMTIGPWSEDPEDARPGFRLLRELLAEARERRAAGPIDQLSMGMSGDLEVAVEEGATWVRVGTALFGPRPTRGTE